MLTATILTVSAVAGSEPGSIEETYGKFGQSMGAMASFVKDVTFDEADIKSIIQYSGELHGMGEGKHQGAAADDQLTDFSAILNDSDYGTWAKSKGLDPEVWLKKFIRVQLMIMKQQLTASGQDASASMTTRLAELDAQKEQLGEDIYQKMKQLVMMGGRVMAMAEETARNLPDPTESEKKLLERYLDQLTDPGE